MNYQDVLADIGHKIRLKRVDKRFSLEYLALQVNSSQAHLSRIENGKVDFSFTTLLRIAEHLDCSLQDLIPSELLQKAVGS